MGKKMSSSGPPKALNRKLGPAPPKTPGFSMNTPGNREFGFNQTTPKMATAAFSGRGMPPMRAPKGSGPASKNSTKQFKGKGKKVF